MHVYNAVLYATIVELKFNNSTSSYKSRVFD